MILLSTPVLGKWFWKGAGYNFADWKTNSSQDTNSINLNPLFVNAPIELGSNLSQGGNISVDPLFIDASDRDFHLQAGSPCIDTGNNSSLNLPVTDFEGDSRMIDGNQDGIDVVDIGADEYIPNTFSYITLLTPNGGEIIPSDSAYTIKWGAPAEVVKFKLKY